MDNGLRREELVDTGVSIFHAKRGKRVERWTSLFSPTKSGGRLTTSDYFGLEKRKWEV